MIDVIYFFWREVEPPLVPPTLQVCIDPPKKVKISKKYIATPLWFSHKSSKLTVCMFVYMYVYYVVHIPAYIYVLYNCMFIYVIKFNIIIKLWYVLPESGFPRDLNVGHFQFGISSDISETRIRVLYHCRYNERNKKYTISSQVDQQALNINWSPKLNSEKKVELTCKPFLNVESPRNWCIIRITEAPCIQNIHPER